MNANHWCPRSLHRVKDDKLFVWTHTTNHWNQYESADGERIEALWQGGIEWKSADGDKLIEVGGDSVRD